MSGRHRNLLIGVIAGLAAAAAGGLLWWSGQDRAGTQAVQYSVAKVRHGNIKAVVSATGTLNPVNTVQVGSQVSGTIQQLAVDFNSQVKAGQVIAQIDPALYRARLAEAEANLKSAEAARDKAEVGVKEARRELDRQSGMYQKKLVAESALDAARFAYDSAVVELKLREAAIAQARAAREREQVNLAYTTIYAPIDGVIVSRDVDVGQTVAASLQAPTLFTIANDLAQMQVEAEVDEAFIGVIKEGQPVKFTVFAYTDRTFDGRVVQVRLQPKVEAGVVKYKCIIGVDNADLALKPGMTATVTIEVARKSDVFKVSNAALRFVPEWPDDELDKLRGDLKPGEAILWRVEGGRLQPMPVKTGIVGERATEVSAEGLADGMQIAVPLKREKNGGKRRRSLSVL